KLLSNERNQLIPCSFILKDFCRCPLVPVFFPVLSALQLAILFSDARHFYASPEAAGSNAC
ncbi:hypothetical protein, partial [Succinimonas sp.]|uniref:hypothetical protein n=1 Tax=Succinimonas sp. TaxID=1936151 RepID=UPI0038682CF2